MLREGVTGQMEKYGGTGGPNYGSHGCKSLSKVMMDHVLGALPYSDTSCLDGWINCKFTFHSIATASIYP